MASTLVKGVIDIFTGGTTTPGKIAFGVLILLSIILIIIGFSTFTKDKSKAVWLLSGGLALGGFLFWNMRREKVSAISIGKELLGGDDGIDLLGEYNVVEYDGAYDGVCGSCGASGGCDCISGGADMNDLFAQMEPDLWDEANAE